MDPFYLRTTKTKKNAFKLVDSENHVYEQHRKSEEVIYWKCEQSYFGCKSRVRTSADIFGTDVPRIVYRSEVAHNHPADRAIVSTRSNMVKLKQSISGSRTCVPTREAVCSTVASCNTHEKMFLPNTNTISRNVRRWRNPVMDAPAIPTARTDFTIPEQSSKYDDGTDGTDFLVYDSGENDADQIFIFSNLKSLDQLAVSNTFAID